MNRIVIVAVVLMMAPVQAQSVETDLYFHIFDPFAKFVVNTQPFDADFFDVGGTNFPTSDFTDDLNTIYGYSTAGPVEYDFIEAGRPRLHPENGIARDVDIDTDKPMTVFLYVDARDIFGGNGYPQALPETFFKATVRSGDEVGSDFNLGDMIVEGTTSAYMFDSRMCTTDALDFTSILNFFCPSEVQGVPVGQYVDPMYPDGYETLPDDIGGVPLLTPDEYGVIEIAIPLAAGTGKITQQDSYNIRLDWWQIVPGVGSNPDQFFSGNMRLVLDENHLPRMTFSIDDPIFVAFLHPQSTAGTVLIHAGVNSPWGTYDVDLENVTIDVEGPSQPQELLKVVAGGKHVHGKHHLPAEITYLWRYREEGAQIGDYKITLTVQNNAHTATATDIKTLTITEKGTYTSDESGQVIETNLDDESNDSPIGVLLPLAALALARRRP